MQNSDGLEAAVADLVAQYDMGSRVLISSFNPVRLRRMRRVAPHLPLGFLHDWSTPLHMRWMASLMMMGVHPEADHPHVGGVTREYLAKCRRRNQRVNVWVANDPAQMHDLRELGVDVIMTDRPDVLRSVLQGER